MRLAPPALALGLLLPWALLPGPARAQEADPDSAVLLIMDSSGSMAEDDGTGRPKIDAAKEALNGLVEELPEGSNVGLRVYGHRVPNTDMQRGCQDSELIVPVGPLDRDSMRERIGSYGARGFTPIGLSLRLGARDLPAGAENRTMILVSDGIDTCGMPPPCEVARQLARRDIDLQIETVGFQVDAEARDMLRCIAEATGGTYTDAASAEDLAAGLSELSVRALRLYQPMGIPVQGTPTPGIAPLLEAGQYTDGISAGESLWYAVELAEGQEISASATMVAVGKRMNLFGDVTILRLQLLGPDLDYGQTELAHLPLLETTTLGLRSEAVGSEDFGAFAEPGRFHLGVELRGGEDFIPGRTFPLELTLEVFGAAAEGDPERPGVQGSGPAALGTGRGPGPPLVAALVGLLLGAMGGAYLMARVRR